MQNLQFLKWAFKRPERKNVCGRKRFIYEFAMNILKFFIKVVFSFGKLVEVLKHTEHFN